MMSTDEAKRSQRLSPRNMDKGKESMSGRDNGSDLTVIMSDI